MPRPAIHPGEILTEELAELGVTQLSRQINVPPKLASSTESRFPQIRCAFGFGNLPIRLDGEWRARWSFGRNRVKHVFLTMLKPWRQFWAARIGRDLSRIIALAC